MKVSSYDEKVKCLVLWSSGNHLLDLHSAPEAPSVNSHLLTFLPCSSTSLCSSITSTWRYLLFIGIYTHITKTYMLLRHNLPTRRQQLRLLFRQLRTQPLNDYQQPENSYAETKLPAFGLATPREVSFSLSGLLSVSESMTQITHMNGDSWCGI